MLHNHHTLQTCRGSEGEISCTLTVCTAHCTTSSQASSSDHHFHVQLPPTAPACHAGRPEVLRCRHLLGSCKTFHVRRRLACEPAQLKGTIWSIIAYGQQGACAGWSNSNCVMAPRRDSRQSVNVQQTAPVTLSHPRFSALNFCCWYLCMALTDVHSTASC